MNLTDEQQAKLNKLSDDKYLKVLKMSDEQLEKLLSLTDNERDKLLLIPEANFKKMMSMSHARISKTVELVDAKNAKNMAESSTTQAKPTETVESAKPAGILADCVKKEKELEKKYPEFLKREEIYHISFSCSLVWTAIIFSLLYPSFIVGGKTNMPFLGYPMPNIAWGAGNFAVWIMLFAFFVYLVNKILPFNPVPTMEFKTTYEQMSASDRLDYEKMLALVPKYEGKLKNRHIQKIKSTTRVFDIKWGTVFLLGITGIGTFVYLDTIGYDQLSSLSTLLKVWELPIVCAMALYGWGVWGYRDVINLESIAEMRKTDTTETAEDATAINKLIKYVDKTANKGVAYVDREILERDSIEGAVDIGSGDGEGASEDASSVFNFETE